MSGFLRPAWESLTQLKAVCEQMYLWFLLIQSQLVDDETVTLSPGVPHQSLCSLIWRTEHCLSWAAHNGLPDTPAGLRLWHGLLGGHQWALGGATPAGD